MQLAAAAPRCHRADAGHAGAAAASTPLWLAQVGPVPVPGARNHDLDDVRARATTCCSATPGCRRSATARTSASAPMRSACCSCAAARACGSAWSARCWRRRCSARWWRRSSRTGAASTTRCSPSRSARCSGSSPSSGTRVTGGEDGLLNIKRPPLRLGFAQIAAASNEALFYFALGAVRAGAGRAVAAGAFAVRPRAARDQAERDARRLRRPQRVALQVAGLRRSRPASRGWPARCSRWRSSRPTRT